MTRPIVKTLPLAPTHDMIEAAYMLIETMPKGSPERHKRLVAKVWETMSEYAPPPKQSGLTRLQQRMHETIADYIEQNGIAPTYQEIGDMMGKSKSDVWQVIHALKRRGVITFRPGHKRSIQLVCRPGEPIPRKVKKK